MNFRLIDLALDLGFRVALFQTISPRGSSGWCGKFDLFSTVGRRRAVRLIRTLRLEFSDKALESETAQAERDFRTTHFGEEARPSIDAVFTDIDMFFDSVSWSSLTKSDWIEYPTATKDGPQRNRFVDGGDENFVYIELA